MFGLSNNHINLINSVFAKYDCINKVVVYGSRAKGNYRAGSDIDLSLFGDNIYLDVLQKIENELDDLLLPYNIDLSIFNKIENNDLIEHIKRVGIVFYEKNE